VGNYRYGYGQHGRDTAAHPPRCAHNHLHYTYAIPRPGGATVGRTNERLAIHASRR